VKIFKIKIAPQCDGYRTAALLHVPIDKTDKVNRLLKVLQFGLLYRLPREESYRRDAHVL